jgi:hypothetical protein
MVSADIHTANNTYLTTGGAPVTIATKSVGKLRMSAHISYFDQDEALKTWIQLEVKFQHRPEGGSWTDTFASPTTGINSSWTLEEGVWMYSDGSIYIVATDKTGLSGNATYEVRFLTRKIAGTTIWDGISFGYFIVEALES